MELEGVGVKARGRARLKWGRGALDNCHSGVAGWTGDAEMAGAMGTETMGRISYLFKVCAKYGSIILGKCPGVNCVHCPSLFSLGYIPITVTTAGTIYAILTMCQSHT